MTCRVFESQLDQVLFPKDGAVRSLSIDMVLCSRTIAGVQTLDAHHTLVCLWHCWSGCTVRPTMTLRGTPHVIRLLAKSRFKGPCSFIL
jgi:hypothetical protein